MSNDPILKASTEVQRALYLTFSKDSNGFPIEAVNGACINMLVMALRQTYHKRADAEKEFDNLFGQAKQMLMNHYNNGSRLQGVFPFPQTIHAQLHVEKDNFGGN